jgi:hypothetical protein
MIKYIWKFAKILALLYYDGMSERKKGVEMAEAQRAWRDLVVRSGTEYLQTDYIASPVGGGLSKRKIS